MTKAESVRSDFKAFFPRIVRNDLLTSSEAIKRTTELLDILRDKMCEAGLSADDVAAGLIFTQPETAGLEHIPAQSLEVPASNDLPVFVSQIEALDRPIFLGVLFAQLDRESLKVTKFVWPFMGGSEAEKGLKYVRDSAPQFGLLAPSELQETGYEA